jgi:CheY-like chemotaxis protein
MASGRRQLMARILIVDDSDEVAEVYREILTLSGYEVDRSAAAYGALQRAVRHDYDLVIMDLLLQGANGAVTALALRGLGPPHDTVPIIVITGGLMPIDEALYKRANFCGRMLKPVLPVELLTEIEKHLER